MEGTAVALQGPQMVAALLLGQVIDQPADTRELPREPWLLRREAQPVTIATLDHYERLTDRNPAHNTEDARPPHTQGRVFRAWKRGQSDRRRLHDRCCLFKYRDEAVPKTPTQFESRVREAN